MLGTLMSVIGSPSNLSVLAAWPSLMSLIHRSIIRRNRRVMAYVTPPSILSCDSCPLLFFFFPPFLDTRRLLGRVLVVEYGGVRAEFRDRVSWYFGGKLSLKFLQLRGPGIFKRANLVGRIFFRENISILQKLLASLKDLVSIREFASVFCCSA